MITSEGSFSEEEWQEVEPIQPEGFPATEFTEEQLLALVKSSQCSLSAASETSTSARGIEITLGKDAVGKRKSKEKGEFEKAFEAFQKQLLHGTHKAHLLCLLSHGMHQSRLCDDPSLQGVLLSLVVNENSVYRENLNNCNEESLLRILKWFVSQRETVGERVLESRTQLEQNALVGGVCATQLFVALLRVLKLRARIVMVLDPLSYKPMPVRKTVSSSEKKPKKKKEESMDTESTAESSRNVTVSKKGRGKTAKNTSKKGSQKPNPASTSASTTECDTSPYFKKSVKKLNTCKRTNSPDDSDQYGTPLLSNDEESEEEFQPPKRKKKRFREQNKINCRVSTKRAKIAQSEGTESEKARLEDDRDTVSWAEVYATSKKKWVCTHLPSCSVDQAHLCERDCSIPLNYVVAFESGSDFSGVIARDVTPRYASDWCTRVYKQRLDRDWWAESLRPFEPANPEEKREEDEDIIALLHAQPLPSSVSDYKNHPLYALKRHLLKFEVIYPEGSKVLGFCRGEPVYSRESVHTLHTRETWLKEGRMIRVGETAFKSVKARPKKGQSVLENQQSMVEVYGRWQTEDYIPQPIVNGVVPRNEYGNVELFQPSMLPPGGAHIRIQGVQKVARKLGIDYAPAMMGWDFHGGFCHPIIEGIVVAEESKGIILEAWEQEEQIRMDKAMKKREKRVVERWRKLTRALLIKERLKRKYDYTD